MSFKEKLGWGLVGGQPWVSAPTKRYKVYVDIFPGPIFVSPKCRCPLDRVVPHERFHCTLSSEFFKTNSYILNWSGS